MLCYNYYDKGYIKPAVAVGFMNIEFSNGG
jgi:hypothetical protein